MFCLQAFLESEPELSSILHAGCYYAETVLTSPCGINFNRRYQFSMNQKPPLLSSLGMVWMERGVSLYSPLKTFWKPPLSTHCITKLRPWKTWGWRQPPGYNPAPHVPPPPPYPEGDGDLRARVPVMEMTKLSAHNKAHWAEGPGCSGSCSISGAVLSPSELCWIIALQPCKITRTSAHGKEKKEKYEQEH